MIEARVMVAALLGVLPAIAAADVATVTAEDVHAALVGGRPVAIVDARTPEEFAQAHLPGAINVFAPEVNASASRLPRDRATRIIFYCRGVG